MLFSKIVPSTGKSYGACPGLCRHHSRPLGRLRGRTEQYV